MAIKRIKIPLKLVLRITCHGRKVVLRPGQTWRCPVCGSVSYFRM